MAAPALSPEEYQFGDTGTVLNTDAALPFVDLTSVDGLGAAPTRQQTHDREDTDGGYVDSMYETIRAVTLEGDVYASPTQLEAYLDQLKADFAPTANDVPLYFGTDAGDTRLVFGKSQGFDYAKDNQRSSGIVEFQVQVLCGDPRIYSSTLTSVSSAGGGAAATVTLGGNRSTPATITVTPDAGTGTAVDFKITNTDTNTTFDFTGTTLNAGDSLVIDLSNRTVILNGTTSERSAMALTGKWYMLQPGDNHFTFAGTGTFRVDARSAWR